MAPLAFILRSGGRRNADRISGFATGALSGASRPDLAEPLCQVCGDNTLKYLNPMLESGRKVGSICVCRDGVDWKGIPDARVANRIFTMGAGLNAARAGWMRILCVDRLLTLEVAGPQRFFSGERPCA